jgi:ankyrin repeat protein
VEDAGRLRIKFIHSQELQRQNSIQESGNLDLVKQLVEAGVDKNAKVGEWQDTALHRAAIYYHKDVAIYLINSEIDLNIMDKNGSTVLDDASGWGDQIIIELFRERGAKTREELEATAEL